MLSVVQQIPTNVQAMPLAKSFVGSSGKRWLCSAKLPPTQRQLAAKLSNAAFTFTMFGKSVHNLVSPFQLKRLPPFAQILRTYSVIIDCLCALLDSLYENGGPPDSIGHEGGPLDRDD